MLSEEQDGLAFGVVIKHGFKMKNNDRSYLIHRNFGWHSIPEDPGIPDRRPADHDRVAPGVRFHAFDVFDTANVTITDHRNADSMFDGGNRIPICFSAEALLPGATMDGDQCGAFCSATRAISR